MPQYNCPECGSGDTHYIDGGVRQCNICRHAAIQEAFLDNPKAVKLDQRELATVLAALRFYQRLGLQINREDPEDDIANEGGTIDPLNVTEIDTLCEEINS